MKELELINQFQKDAKKLGRNSDSIKELKLYIEAREKKVGGRDLTREEIELIKKEMLAEYKSFIAEIRGEDEESDISDLEKQLVDIKNAKTIQDFMNIVSAEDDYGTREALSAILSDYSEDEEEEEVE